MSSPSSSMWCPMPITLTRSKLNCCWENKRSAPPLLKNMVNQQHKNKVEFYVSYPLFITFLVWNCLHRQIWFEKMLLFFLRIFHLAFPKEYSTFFIFPLHFRKKILKARTKWAFSLKLCHMNGEEPFLLNWTINSIHVQKHVHKP